MKTSGLGDQFWVSGVDLSGDTQSAKTSGGPALFDFTPINVLAMVRAGGQRQGSINWTSFFDPTGAHPVLSALPTTDILTTYICNLGSVTPAIGNPAYCCQGPQLNYDPTRSNVGMFTFGVQNESNGFGGEWGVLLTPGMRTDAAATNGAALDAAGGAVSPAVPASLTPVVNPAGIPASVVISGGTMTNVSVNGVTVGTGAGTYPVPAGAQITMTYTVAPTWTWTWPSTGFGAQAYLHAFALTGTDATVTIQDSADNSTFANVASFTFSQTTAAPSSQRIAISNAATLRRYVRAITTTVGGFTSFSFGVVLMRNTVAGVTF